MFNLLFSLLTLLRSSFKPRLALQLEIVALRHQLGILLSSSERKRPRFQNSDRLLWVWLFSVLVGVAASPGHYSTENGGCVASDGLSAVLEMEESNWAAREARHSEGSSGPHSADESSQSLFGELPEFTANCSNSALRLPKPRLANTWSASRNLLRRLGGLS